MSPGCRRRSRPEQIENNPVVFMPMEPTRSETRPHPPTTSPEHPMWRVFLPFLIIAAVFALVGVVAFVLLVASLLQTTPVTVVLDGEAAQYDTRAVTVGDLVDDLGIALGVARSDSNPHRKVRWKRAWCCTLIGHVPFH